MRPKHLIIIGQGISGTVISFELLAAGKEITIINDSNGNPASLTAGAVLNPNKLKSSKQPTAADFTTFNKVIQYYQHLEKLLQTQFLYEKPLAILDEQAEATHSSFNWGIDRIYNNTYFLDTHHFFGSSKQYFRERGVYQEAVFDVNELYLQDGSYRWRDIVSDAIIYCEGARARNNPLFTKHTFIKNKGDALIVRIPDLSQEQILQIGDLRLLPIGNQNFWLGTQHIWDYDSVVPDEKWKETQIAILQKVLNVPYEIVAHLAAERPTTPGQKLILDYDEDTKIGIVNGMGSRGFTQAALQIPDFVKEKILKQFSE